MSRLVAKWHSGRDQLGADDDVRGIAQDDARPAPSHSPALPYGQLLLQAPSCRLSDPDMNPQFASDNVPTVTLLTFVVIQFVLNILHYIPAKYWKLWVDRTRFVLKTLLDVSTLHDRSPHSACPPRGD